MEPTIEQVALDALLPYAGNSRQHSETQVAQIAASMKEFGFTNPILIDNDNGIIAGHGRVLAARLLRDNGVQALPNLLGLDTLPCIRLAHLTDAEKRAYVIADNKLAENATWDWDALAGELGRLHEEGFDLPVIGFSDEEIRDLLAIQDAPLSGEGEGGGAGSLADRFGIPPFTVLNAREGWWQERKRSWMDLGIRSELGRADNLTYEGAAKAFDHYRAQQGKNVKNATQAKSIFDPVLCELAYRWFAPKGGTILDPFAGGSVRGIVAAHLGRQYIGVDLSENQVKANREQWAEMEGVQPAPVWHIGDSANIDKIAKGVEADFLFMCPPYADLEVYSDDPADISTMDYAGFTDAYSKIIAKAAFMLKHDRFACIVVGEVRDKAGMYRDFVGDTVQAFRDAGLEYYNEAILVTAVGSLPIRVGKQFTGSRKLGKTHQNVLVFVKGDPKAAAAAVGDCEFGEIVAAPEDEEAAA